MQIEKYFYWHYKIAEDSYTIGCIHITGSGMPEICYTQDGSSVANSQIHELSRKNVIFSNIQI